MVTGHVPNELPGHSKIRHGINSMLLSSYYLCLTSTYFLFFVAKFLPLHQPCFRWRLISIKYRKLKKMAGGPQLSENKKDKQNYYSVSPPPPPGVVTCSYLMLSSRKMASLSKHYCQDKVDYTVTMATEWGITGR